MAVYELIRTHCAVRQCTNESGYLHVFLLVYREEFFHDGFRRNCSAGMANGPGRHF
jgi:hypothetical protein